MCALHVCLAGLTCVPCVCLAGLGQQPGLSPPHRVQALSGSQRSDRHRLTDTNGQHMLHDKLDVFINIERQNRRWGEDFLFDRLQQLETPTGMFTKQIIQLTICWLFIYCQMPSP